MHYILVGAVLTVCLLALTIASAIWVSHERQRTQDWDAERDARARRWRQDRLEELKRRSKRQRGEDFRDHVIFVAMFTAFVAVAIFAAG